MCSNVTIVSVVVVVVAMLASLVMFYPPPPLSTRLLAWQDGGKFFSYDAHNVFYMDVNGVGSEGTVICLHGFPTFSWDWSKVLPGLQTQFSRVILLDFLGFGLSDKPKSHSYSIFEQADIVVHLARRLSVTKAHLLSHDYGDTVALELLARYNQAALSQEKPSGSAPPLGLLSLTMLNGGIFPQTNHPRPLQKLLLIPVLGPALAHLTFFSLFQIGFGEIFGENKPSEDEYLDFYAGLRHKNGHHVSSSLLQYIPERQAYKNRWVGALRTSQVPVLMIYGPADPVNPPQFTQLFRQEAPQHKLVVLDDRVGHYPQWEDAESVLQHMAQFMQQTASKPSS